MHLNSTDLGLDVIDDGLDVVLRVGLPTDESVISKKILTPGALSAPLRLT